MGLVKATCILKKEEEERKNLVWQVRFASFTLQIFRIVILDGLVQTIHLGVRRIFYFVTRTFCEIIFC